MKRIVLFVLAAVAICSCCNKAPKTLEVPECVITAVPADVKEKLGLDDFYKKYANVNGLHLMSSWRVPDSCFVQAHKVLYAMTSYLPADVLQAMVNVDTRVGIMARYEGTEDIPEHKYLANRDTSDIVLNWNCRARGLGGELELPLSTCAEENILAYQIDKYHAEDIMIHEFSHSIHLIGMIQVHPEINDVLQDLLDKAHAEGKYQGTYAGTCIEEYWAEGVQDWFNVNAESEKPNGKHNWVNTREDLKKYDPRLYKLLKKYFPEVEEQVSMHKKVNLYTHDYVEGSAVEETVAESAFDVPECVITPVPADVKERLNIDKFYSKYAKVNGIHLMSSWRVPDSCFVQAHKVLYCMTCCLPEDVLQAMTKVDTRVAIMARYEGTTDLPEQVGMKRDTTLNWDIRARGLGGTIYHPMSSCAEENILAYQIDKYHAEDIMIHEFSHSIHLIGMIQVHPEINDELTKLLDMAHAEGKYAGTYMGSNIEEYWAEGVQDWFNVNAEVEKPDGKHNWVNTREDLKNYDPRLYELLSRYFPEVDEQISMHKKVNLYTHD